MVRLTCMILLSLEMSNLMNGEGLAIAKNFQLIGERKEVTRWSDKRMCPPWAMTAQLIGDYCVGEPSPVVGSPEMGSSDMTFTSLKRDAIPFYCIRLDKRKPHRKEACSFRIIGFVENKKVRYLYKIHA